MQICILQNNLSCEIDHFNGLQTLWLKKETVTTHSFGHICTEMDYVRSMVIACHPPLFIAVSNCKQIP